MTATMIAFRGVAVIGILAVVATTVLIATHSDPTLIVGFAGLASSCVSGLLGYASHNQPAG